MKGTRPFIFAPRRQHREYEGARPLRCSKRDQYDPAVRQVLVDLVELRAALRADRVRERKEAALAAHALADLVRRERPGVPLDDRKRQGPERLRVAAHHLDRELGRKLEELFALAHAGSSVENSRCVALYAV